MIPTRWCVITGAPCAGKTTIIEKLGQLGFRTTFEPAGTYIRSLQDSGLTMDEIKNIDPVIFQENLLQFYKKMEADLIPDEIVFRDRAMPDAVTYTRVMAKQDDVEDILELATEFKYEYVFVFERLPYSDEGVRINNEDDALARHLGEQLEIEYRNLGYEVIRVPVMPVDDRVQFILDRVKVEVASPVSVPLVLQPVAV